MTEPFAPRSARRPLRAMHAALAARQYFLDGRTIKDIAAELGVSRFKVARLIDWARAEGLVRVEVAGAIRSDPELSADLRAGYGLEDALVVADLDGSADAIAPELAEVAALAVAEIVTPSDVVGISWGRTLDLLVEQLPDLTATKVVQLIGGFATLESASGGIELVRRFAEKAHADGYPLLAPLRVRDPAAAASLRRDPIVAETLRLIDEVTVVVAGIGAWGDPPASRMAECFSAREVAKLRRQGVCADMCGLLFAADGEALRAWADERIGIDAPQLEGVRTVVAVAGGVEKREALAAVLRSGVVDVVITDAGSARSLLDHPSS
ncbi:MAG: transcriptional regulator [Actinobacteria bacterium]|nr:transcriptional regulator [Actinomycetota bacterium]